MQSGFDVGMKIYDNDWFLKYGLSYQDAARCLSDWGVTFVMPQNKHLPMPDSAVESEVNPALQARYASLDDRKFRDALGEAGIAYWLTVCMFFDPWAIEEDPGLAPVGSDGKRMVKTDWYIGIAPSMEGYVERKTAAIAAAARALEPDGIFMSFTRWPGFWELWTPNYTRRDFPEYSYDSHTLSRFSRDTGLSIPNVDPAGVAAWIDDHARQTWTDWKCELVEETLRGVKDACGGLPLMLNTLPFRSEDFEDARAAVFGQDVKKLSEVVDVFEVMTYHQILKQDTGWIAVVGEEVKRQTSNIPSRRTVCTLQVRPHYLEGMHSGEKRAARIGADEFAKAVLSVEKAGLDGIVVFVWSDLLELVFRQDDYRRIDAIRLAVDNREARKV